MPKKTVIQFGCPNVPDIDKTLHSIVGDSMKRLTKYQIEDRTLSVDKEKAELARELLEAWVVIKRMLDGRYESYYDARKYLEGR